VIGSASYRRAVGILASVIAVAMTLYHMYAIAWAPPEALIFRGTHLLFAMTLIFLLYPVRAKGEMEEFKTAEERAADEKKGPNPSILDWLWIALTVVCIGYLFVNYNYIVNRIPYIDDPTKVDIVLGVLCNILVLEATRRVIGWSLPILCIISYVYAMFFTDVSFDGLLDQMYLTTEGIFGSTLAVSASYVLIFVVFGAFMERTGTGQLFMDFAMSLTGRFAGGPGKVSVVSSSLFGTISGSAVANVMVDGPITIPLMKRSGFPPKFAAAIESVASTGGQIMPPIMGAAAFVMAEFLAVSYFQITVWAWIPSLLYYLACFAAVHFEAKRRGILGVPKEQCPRLKAVMKERGHLFIPIAIVFVGMYNDYSAPLAAMIGSLACFPVALMRRVTREGLTWRAVWDAMVDGAKNSVAVALACASSGIIIGVIALTGVGINFTQLVLGLAQNSLFLALFVTALAGIVLGTGLPTTPSYILMVSLLVPALIKLGVVEPAAHMFAFYFAILSAITPPVALAVFAAASLAKADMWESGWAAMKIGAAGFIVPFMFAYEPALLTIGSWTDIITATVTASIGCILLAAGLHGYYLRHCAVWERCVLVAAALCLVNPYWATDIIGFGLGVAMTVLQLMRRADKPVKSTAS
jgi:TRAP transporter 4TM/12TM fusion protein